MEDYSTGSESDYANSWITWFLSTKGNEYFVEIDEDYILDRFNLTGLNGEVLQEYGRALDLITDQLEDEESLDEEVRESIDTSARFLYGLIHARYILTSRGLAKMLDKYRKADFGRCPRVFCYSQPLLPVGLSDAPYQKAVKLYCPRCEDIYSPKSNRHGSIDGAYFGTTFPHMLFMVYPQMVPAKGSPPQPGNVGGAGGGGGSGGASGMGQAGMGLGKGQTGIGAAQAYMREGPTAVGVGSVSTSAAGLKAEVYDPRLFGFRVNEGAKLKRWREAMRDKQVKRLEALEREEPSHRGW